jgi:hypothetical protein
MPPVPSNQSSPHPGNSRRSLQTSGHERRALREDGKPDELVPNPLVAKECGVSLMTLWRWDGDSEMAFPPPIYINRRIFRSRKLLEAFKKDMLHKAVEQRKEAIEQRKARKERKAIEQRNAARG